MDYIAELFAGEVEQLIEINATVCKLSEGSLLLDLCSSHSSALHFFLETISRRESMAYIFYIECYYARSGWKQSNNVGKVMRRCVE
jgi:hypothetical protein